MQICLFLLWEAFLYRLTGKPKFKESKLKNVSIEKYKSGSSYVDEHLNSSST